MSLFVELSATPIENLNPFFNYYFWGTPSINHNICKRKRKKYAKRANGTWLSDLMFLTDMLEHHLQTFNWTLQGKEKILMSQTLFSFEIFFLYEIFHIVLDILMHF